MYNTDIKITGKMIVNELARRDFKYFVKATKRDFKFSRFSICVCEALNTFLKDIIAGKRPILIIEAPPQHGKSELASRRFPAFAFGINPNFKIAGCSYAADLATSMNMDVQKIMLGEEYYSIFPNSALNSKRVVTADNAPKRNSERFDIVNNDGYYVATGVGGPLTGKTVDIGIIDDPIKNMAEANSDSIKAGLNSWYNTVFLTRLSKNSGQLIMMTRWCVDDLVGTILKQNKGNDRVTRIKFSAINEKGEALVPELHPISQLNEIKKTLSISEWEAMYQQHPIIEGGNLFKETMFVRGAEPSDYDYTFITCDTAYSGKQENDYTVASLWGVRTFSDGVPHIYLLDIFREKIKASDAEAYLVPFFKKHNNYNFKGVLIEPKGHGIYLNQKMVQYGLPMMSEDDILEFFSDRRMDKVTRASVILPHLHSNPIICSEKIPEPIFEDLKDELLNFPKGTHDDSVDCLIDGVKYVYNRPLSILDVL